MKESEAKEKTCPFAFIGMPLTLAYSRVEAGADEDTLRAISQGSFCKGSDCMMWEAYQAVEKSEDTEKPDGEGWEEVDAVEWPVTWCRTVETGEGDCGLKPYENGCCYPG